MSHELTQDYLKSVLAYDPETGVFAWKRRDRSLFKTSRAHRLWNTKFAGKIAGSDKKSGCGKLYSRIRLLGKQYRSHRLAFLYMEGAMPLHEVDHINGDGRDNRWINLRQVTGAENARNRRLPISNSSGFMGVSWSKHAGKWVSRISVNGIKKTIGYFDDISDAVDARRHAESKNAYHENHGTARRL